MKAYDVVIVGGGVTGTSLFYLLSKFSNVKKIALLEKYKKVAQVNSSHKNNSQTLHYGDIETNYSREKAAKVKDAAVLVERYVETYGNHLFNKTEKMVLAVGKKEIEELKIRYSEIKDLFPELRLIGPEEIARLDENLVRGRKKYEPIMALASPKGYAINFGKLSESFVIEGTKREGAEIFLGCKVKKIVKEKEGYLVHTKKETLRAKVVVVSAGAHSLELAQNLGYGKHFIILPAMGNFFTVENALKTKVYTMQIKKIPFAAVHGDPDVASPTCTRFGPTTRVFPILERRNPKTFFDFAKIFKPKASHVVSLFSIIADWDIFKFVMRNFSYDIPFIGKWHFLKSIRKIVPSIRYKDVHHGKGIGGLRPQLVDTRQRKLEKGEVKLVKENIIFNMTPSPGASVCLGNAEKDAQQVVSFLGEGYQFDKQGFRKHIQIP